MNDTIPKRIHFIVNPFAGGGRARKRLSKAIAPLRERGIDITVHETDAPGHATDLAHSIDGEACHIVAAGGDGTVNEVVNGLAHPDHVIGVLPSGTGNDFARLIGVRTPAQTAESLLRGRIATLDTVAVRILDASGRVHERVFINTLGVGFDAAVAVRAATYTWGNGIVPYLIAVFAMLKRYRAVDAAISWDGHQLGSDLFLATIGNGTTSGGGFILTPDAIPDDGLLDLCLVRSVSIGRVLRVLPMTLHGGHISEKEVVTARAAAFSIELAAPLPLHADGEILTHQAVRIDVAIRPGTIRVATLIR